MTRQAKPGPAPARPTGTVTFLFSDIEGSTQHWEERRATMPKALRRHDELMRAAIESHGGYVFKEMGDAFCAAFWRASDGVAAAIAAQRALGTEDWSAVGGLRARMALHSGATEERDGDYFGPPVNRIARLLAIVHGAQVVVSEATAQLLRGTMPEHSDLRDLGDHRLKDLVEPERVWQLLAPGLPDAFPPLRSLESLPNNLPRQLTPLIGREDVVAEIEALAPDHPLVTLVGAGGVGKTRVALQVGANLLDRYEYGVWFVDLAPIAHGAMVARGIAAVFDLRESPSQQTFDSLLAYMKNKRMLVILDNCEHVIEEAARIAQATVQSCPEVTVLATSREALAVGGEQVYRMPSLSVPPPEMIAHLTAANALTYGAVALFVDRAQGANRTFILADDSVPVVVDICRRLDGIALAIELAAARTRVVSVQDLADKLDERFRLLTGGRRTAIPRQQTLRALIDWSYDLLSEDERAIFRRLGIFTGDFSLDAATSVCAGDAVVAFDILDSLSALADKSLLQAETAGNKTRFRLLLSMRAYAREKLLEHSEFETAARAHACAYLNVAEELESVWDTTPDLQWKALAEPELENSRTALRWAFGKPGDVNLAQRLAAALRPVWSTLAPSEGLRWVRVGLEAADSTTPIDVGARLQLSAAHLAMVAQQYKHASVEAERALQGFTVLGDRRGTALAQLFTGAARGLLGEVAEGESLLHAALAESRRAGANRAVGAALMYLALLRLRNGDAPSSRALFSEALDVLTAVGAVLPAAHIALPLAELEFQNGNATEAVRLVSDALEAERALKNRDGVAFDLCNLAAYLVSLDRWDDAAAHAREALALARERVIATAAMWALQHLAAVAALRSIPDATAEALERRRAARLIGFVDAHLDELEMHRDFTDREEYARIIANLHDALGAEAATFMEEGRSWTETRAADEALRS
jgi:predicted ATPase/class 3 adenylate cyclase